MRFFLIIGIGAVIAWAVVSKACSGDILPKGLGPVVAAAAGPGKAGGDPALAPAARPGGDPALAPVGVSAVAPVRAGGAGVPVVVEASGSYRFEWRAVPSSDWFSQWAQCGASVVVDPLTGVVSVFGAAGAVKALLAALREVDLVQGSCAVYAWCVYVDESQVKGWDLVAAIREASGDGLRAVVGRGGVTLDVTAGDLGVILAVIADGSSVEVLQRPFLRLTHNIPAIVETISEIPLPASTVSNGVAQSSVQYRKVGLQLNILPRFMPGERVVLGVEQSNGLVGPSVDVNGSSVPQIDSQRVATSVELVIGQAAVLGGVRTERARKARGLLRDKTEISRGYMFVVIATASEVPVATRWDAPEVSDPFCGVLDGAVLPMRDEELPIDLPAILPPPARSRAPRWPAHK